MGHVIRCLFASVSFLMAGLGIVGCDYSSPHADFGQLWGKLGAGIVDTIKQPNSVDYYNVAPALPGAGPQTYQPANKEQALSDENIAKLQKLLLNDSHYLFGVQKKCVFVPETGFRFKKKDKDVVLLVSLSCQQVVYDLGGQQIRLDIDPSAESFADFIKHLPH